MEGEFGFVMVICKRCNPTVYISGASPRTNHRDGTSSSRAPGRFSGTGEASAACGVGQILQDGFELEFELDSSMIYHLLTKFADWFAPELDLPETVLMKLRRNSPTLVHFQDLGH